MRGLFRSLHARMLGLSVLATLVALALAGWAIAGVLEHLVIQGLDRRLDAEVTLLASTVNAHGQIDRPLLEQRLGTLESGRGWRWQILAPGQTLGSRDFPDLDAGPPHPPPPPGAVGTDGPNPPQPDLGRLHPREGASEGGIHVHARTMTIQTTAGPVTLTATAPRGVIQRPIVGALAPLLLILATLAVLLAGATFIQLRLGLRPVRRLRDQVAAIRAGERETLDEDQASELKPLATELNALSSENKAALRAARQSAANLAHALKTPVAALALELRDEPPRAAQLARIDATIRHHLARARAEAVDRRTATPLAPAVADLVSAVRRLHAPRDIEIVTVVPQDLIVAIESHDLDELLGNLLDNAARHALHRIRVEASQRLDDRRRITIEIADDGPGISEADRARVAQPGVRLDERGDGHGFGLTIVTELVALYGGSMRLEEALAGGLLVKLDLPAASFEVVARKQAQTEQPARH